MKADFVLPGYFDLQKPRFQLARDVTHVHADRKLKIASEVTNTTLARNEKWWYFCASDEISLDVPLILLCLGDLLRRTIGIGVDNLASVGSCDSCFRDIQGPRRGTCDYQSSPATPIDLDRSGFFDAGNLNFDKIVRDGIANVYIGVVWIGVRVWVPTCEIPEEGIVLACSLVEMVHNLEWIAMKVPRVCHVESDVLCLDD
jgi:hypothetical protein